MNTSQANTTEPALAATEGMRTDTKIWAYGGGTLLVVGTIGNILSAIIMMRPPLRKTATSLYLTVLAITDLTILHTTFMIYWLTAVFGIPILEISDAMCQWYHFLMFWLIRFEAWTLTSVAAERVVATFAPVFYKIWFTRKFVVIELVIIGIVSAGVDVGVTWYFRVTNGACTIADAHIGNMVGYADLVLASSLPSVIMFTCNVCIIVKLAYSRFNRNSNKDQSRTNVKYMTIVLMMVTFVFLVTSTPLTVFYHQAPNFYAQAETPEEILKLDITTAALNVLYFANNSVNFFTYCLSGRRFREELRKLFCKESNKVHPKSSDTNQTD